MNLKILYLTLLSFMTGACCGSFACCQAYRIVHHISLLQSHSECDQCHHPLAGSDLIPIFSYLLSKGRCRYCNAEIPKLCLISELIPAFCFAFSALHFSFSIELLRWWGLMTILMILSLTDLETYEIPDGCHIAAAILWTVTIPLCDKDPLLQFREGITGAVSLSGLILIVTIFFAKFAGKQGMGGGDLKLFFISGLYLGLIPAFTALLICSLMGLAVCLLSKEKRIPFGPCISAAVFAAWIMSPMLLN